MPLPSQTDPKLWLALLHEMNAAGGQAKPNAIYPKMRAHFPEITDADLALTISSGKNQWTNRVQWVRQDLIYSGCIDGATPGIWKITPHGRAWASRPRLRAR